MLQVAPENRNPYRGVSWNIRHGRWRMKISTNGSHPCGIQWLTWPKALDDPEVAAQLWDVAAKLLRGPDAVFNFDGQPPEGYAELSVRAWLRKHDAIR